MKIKTSLLLATIITLAAHCVLAQTPVQRIKPVTYFEADVYLDDNTNKPVAERIDDLEQVIPFIQDTNTLAAITSRLAQAEADIANRVEKTGDTMSGDLTMSVDTNSGLSRAVTLGAKSLVYDDLMNRLYFDVTNQPDTNSAHVLKSDVMGAGSGIDADLWRGMEPDDVQGTNVWHYGNNEGKPLQSLFLDDTNTVASIDASAYGAAQVGWFSGTSTIGGHAYGAQQAGIIVRSTVGTYAYGARQAGTITDSAISGSAYGAQQVGFITDSTIGNSAIGAQQVGTVASGGSATNSGKGSIQRLTLKNGQGAYMSGNAAIGLNAVTVTNDSAIVGGDGNESHGDGSLTMHSVWTGSTNLGESITILSGRVAQTETDLSAATGLVAQLEQSVSDATNAVAGKLDRTELSDWSAFAATNGVHLPVDSNSVVAGLPQARKSQPIFFDVLDQGGQSKLHYIWFERTGLSDKTGLKQIGYQGATNTYWHSGNMNPSAYLQINSFNNWITNVPKVVRGAPVSNTAAPVNMEEIRFDESNAYFWVRGSNKWMRVAGELEW